MYSTLYAYSSFSRHHEGYQDPWMMVQYDDRVLSDMDLEGCKRNEAYCKKHGYTYRMITTSSHHLPPYWQKVKLVQELLHTSKGILWMDTDAVVMNHELTLDELCPQDKHMVFSPDPPIWGNVSSFNAGVWLIKNTQEGNDIMKQWMDCYDATKWNYNGSWTSTGIWAGDTYEQGAFAQLVPRIRSLVHIAPWRVLQDVHVTPDTFTMHFSNHQKSLRPSIFSMYPHSIKH